MGTRVTVVRTGQEFEPLEISQVEDVFTMDASTSDGGIPMITLTLPPGLDALPLIGEAVKIESSTLGSTSGIMAEMSINNMGAVQVTLNTKLNPLVRLAKAKPFVGTVQDLVRYYFKLGGITGGYQFAPGVTNVHVNAQGWEDTIWTRLVKLQQIYRFEIALVSDYILVRPWRTVTADIGHLQDSTYTYSALPISKTIEVDYFTNREARNEVVYPVNGVQADASSISADAREVVEVEIQLSASLASVKQPKFRTSVSKNYKGSESVYTVIDKDGYIIKEDFWKKHGGKVSVKIGPDSTSVIVTMVGPNYSKRAPYKLAYAPMENKTDSKGATKKEPNTDLQFESLFLVGSGVRFDKKTMVIQTGARPQDIVQEVGATVSDPAMSSEAQAWNTILPVLNESSGGKLVMSGTIARINQRGKTGELTNIPFQDVEDLREGVSYGIMEDDIHAGMTYGEVESFYNQQLVFELENQTFGNAAGARLFDPVMQRWFRVTSATITLAGVTFTAEDDLLYTDVEDWLDGKTYGYVEDTLWGGLDYRAVEMRGLK